MAKDLIGEIGLDITDFKKSVDEMNSRLEKLEGAVGKTSKATEKGFAGVGKAAKQVAAAFGIAFGAKAVVDYVRNLGTLHSSIQRTREGLAKGSVEAEKFNESVNSVKGGEAASIEVKRVEDTIKNYKTTFDQKAAAVMSKLREGLTRKWFVGSWEETQKNLRPEDPDNPYTFDELMEASTATPETRKIQKEHQYNQQTVDIGKRIVELKHEAADANAQDLSITQKQLDALAAEAKLQSEIARYAVRTGIADEQMRASALQSEAAANAQHRSLKLQMESETRSAQATTTEMELQLKGMGEIGKIVKDNAEYENKILAARRAGNTELREAIQKQKDLNTAKGAVAEHNMTPAQRLAERRAGRKFSRDSQKTAIHEEDLESRLNQAEREGHRITPGSELDRFRARRDARRAANGQAARAGEAALNPITAKFYSDVTSKFDTVISKLSFASE